MHKTCITHENFFPSRGKEKSLETLPPSRRSPKGEKWPSTTLSGEREFWTQLLTAPGGAKGGEREYGLLMLQGTWQREGNLYSVLIILPPPPLPCRRRRRRWSNIDNLVLRPRQKGHSSAHLHLPPSPILLYSLLSLSSSLRLPLFCHSTPSQPPPLLSSVLLFPPSFLPS